MKGALLFVKCLEAEGVEYIFGVPGEENLDLLEAIRNSKIKFITVRNEQSAAFMAATLGRLTGRVGVALSTLGPGATNLLSGVAYAQLGGMPVLFITGQKPIKKSKQGSFQKIDVVHMMNPVTKYSATAVSAGKIPSMVRQAVKLATAERPGASHIELPEDIAREETNALPIIPQKIRRPAPDPKALGEMMEMLERAKHPIVVLAAGANRRLIRKQFKAFLEKTDIPFVATQMGKGVEDENDPRYIGTTALSSGDYVHQALSRADVVLMVGHDISEKPPIILTPPEHKVINLNFYPSEVDDIYIPALEVVGDISNALWQMSENIKPNPKWDFKYFYDIKKNLEDSIKASESAADFPLRPERVVGDIQKSLPENAILALDNGMYKIWLARNFKAKEQNSVLLDNALATMGAGLSSGIAAKILNPDKPVLCVVGDGGFLMNIGDLETAVRLKLDLVILVLNDSGYGMIRWKQKAMAFPPFALSFGNPDFVKLAESFSAKGYKVTSPDDLSELIRNATKQKGVQIIECPINYTAGNAALALIAGPAMEEEE